MDNAQYCAKMTQKFDYRGIVKLSEKWCKCIGLDENCIKH